MPTVATLTVCPPTLTIRGTWVELKNFNDINGMVWGCEILRGLFLWTGIVKSVS